MMFNVPLVELQHHLPVAGQLLVLLTTVPTLQIKKLLVPATARFDVLNADQGL